MVVMTVLMAVYDPPLDQLAQAVESIFRQTFADFEFLIVDDGSASAGTHQALAVYAARDRRVRIQREPHGGLARSLNAGLRTSKGTWIARQDADDWSDPQRLERQLAFVQQRPGTILCGSEAWTHRRDGERLWRLRLPHAHGEIARAFERGSNPLVHGAAMFRRDAALAAGGYREEFRCSQDYDFFWRLAERGRAANLGEPLYHYRFSGASVSAARGAEQIRAHRAAQTLAACRRRGELENPAAALAAAGLETQDALRGSLRQADHLLLAGEGRRAARAYWDLVRHHPASLLAWGKLVRCGVFLALPPAREACFR